MYRKFFLLDYSPDLDPVLENKNELKIAREDKIKEKDYFKEISRDKLITDLFFTKLLIVIF